MNSKHLIIQNKPTKNKIMNLYRLSELFDRNINNSINFVILPECFNSPYGVNYFIEYAEELNINDKNPTVKFLYDYSIRYPKIYFVAGSIPEKKNDKYFNTCTVWKNGEIITIYIKIHLFDVDIPDQVCFKESKTVSAGDKPVYFDTEFGRIGLGICFDLRFNNLSNYYAENKCDIIIYPGNFTTYTGKLHWELLLRTRAVDSQCWVIGCSSATNHDLEYHSYGHSMVVEPWGKVVSPEINDQENVFVCEIHPELAKSFRRSIPIQNNKVNFCKNF